VIRHTAILLACLAYAQDDASREQFDLNPDGQVRDFRVMLNGRIKTGRAITWSAGFMYDSTNDEWLVRQTGVMIAVPELSGHVFVGRSKEGISLNMVMVGYAGWTMERSTTVVATVPLLADGIKWMGHLPKRRLLFNLGWYTDVLSEASRSRPTTTSSSRAWATCRSWRTRAPSCTSPSRAATAS